MTTADPHPPVVLQCPKCGVRVILHLPGVATCLPCGQRMRQVATHTTPDNAAYRAHADRPVKA